MGVINKSHCSIKKNLSFIYFVIKTIWFLNVNVNLFLSSKEINKTDS